MISRDLAVIDYDDQQYNPLLVRKKKILKVIIDQSHRYIPYFYLSCLLSVRSYRQHILFVNLVSQF